MSIIQSLRVAIACLATMSVLGVAADDVQPDETELQDEILLKDGSLVKGVLKDIRDGVVTLETGFAGSISIHIDQIEAKDKQLYYRLKIVSFNDDVTYSPVISLLPKNCGEDVGDFLGIYPNPVKNGREVNVIYENESNTSNANLQIISMLGVVVINKDLNDLDSGINNFTVDLTSIPAGNYFLQIENSEGRFSRVKLSVMKE